MGKAEAGTPKWLANKMKSKGLQKLRWFCQMCNKQCRDENGFKCHTQSEAHQRQLLLFADNPNKFLSNYSTEFERDFLYLLKRCHGTKRVKANKVYQSYIAEKDHIHMNATRWETLTGFVQYLGRTGKCLVDQTEEGWFITWIDRDPETIARQEALAKRDKLQKDDEERMAEFIHRQVIKAQHDPDRSGTARDSGPTSYTELKRENDQAPLSLGLLLSQSAPGPPTSSMKGRETSSSVFKVPKPASEENGQNASRKKSGPSEKKRKISALEEIKAEEERQKRNKGKAKASPGSAKDSGIKWIKSNWLKPDIVVKIVTRSLGDQYYKQKGYVHEVVDKYAAIVILFQLDKKVKLDQAHLETVIPAEGHPVLIVNGQYRGQRAVLQRIDVDSYSAYLQLDSTAQTVKLPYEHFSKLCPPTS